MKHKLILLLSFFIGFVLQVSAQSTSGGITYTLSADGLSYEVSGCDKTTLPANVIIPSEYEDKPVTAILANAFEGCSATSIELPSSVISIGDNAFKFCSNLTSVILPPSITSLNDGLFNECVKLASITIPETVTSIGAKTFLRCEQLTSLTIPNSVTTIGPSAFGNCIGLTSMNIPTSIHTISKGMFGACSNLTSVIIPTSVTTIEEDAFRGCSRLNTLTIPESVTSIGETAFYSSGLTSVIIPSSVTSIADRAFGNCFALSSFEGKFASEDHRCLCDDNGCLIAFAPKGLTEYTTPSSVTSIGNYAFSECNSLTSLNIQGTVTSIGESAFYDCEGLTSINLPSSITSIEKGAFIECRGLTSIILPENLISIGEWAFNLCDNLESIVIPGSVTSIGQNAFQRCQGLKSVTIPESVTSIGYKAFFLCSSLTSITCENPNPANLALGDDVFKSVPTSSCALNVPTQTGYLYAQADQWNAFNSINEIGVTTEGLEFTLKADDTYSVSGHTSELPENVVIPSCYKGKPVTQISSNALASCTDLKSVILPETIISIGDFAFNLSMRLESIVIPGSVTSIGESAFKRCEGLKSVTIPASVTSIDDEAFLYCHRLTSITCEITNPSKLALGWSVFYNVSPSCVLNVPAQTGYLYAQADQWSDFKENINEVGVTIDGLEFTLNSDCYTVKVINPELLPKNVIIPSFYEGSPVTTFEGVSFNNFKQPTSVILPESINTIIDAAFEGCTNLTSVILPKSLTKINDYMFDGCCDLASITIPQSVTRIGSSAFEGCSSLTSINLPESVTAIGISAFEGCSSLTSINLPESVIGISFSAFKGCSSLTSINLPESVTSIVSSTFEGCSSLTSINLPVSVTIIGVSAFKGCSSLTSINLPESVTAIGISAFEDCSSLTSINLPESVTTIGDSAFRRCSSLTSVTIPQSLTSLPSMFAGCTGLTAFYGKYASDDNRCLYDESGLLLSFAPYGLTCYSIPETINTIASGAFTGCDGLTSISIPESVVTISGGAFQNCSGLTSISIPESVTNIGTKALNNCTSLEKIKVKCSDPSQITLGTNVFSGCPTSTCILFVPEGSKELYEAAEQWSAFENIEEMPSHLEIVDGQEYEGLYDFEDVDITYTRTFKNTNWQSLYIPYNLSYEEWSDKAQVAELGGIYSYEDRPTIIEFITVKEGELLPNTPYVIRALEASTQPITFTSTNKVLKGAPEEETRFICCSSPRWTYKLYGNHKQFPKERADELQAKVLGGGKFIYSSTPIKPMRFYLIKEKSSNGYWGAPAISRNDEEILVMIDGVLLSEAETNALLNTFADSEEESLYNLQGIQVDENYKGIVIKNGKKLIKR